MKKFIIFIVFPNNDTNGSVVIPVFDVMYPTGDFSTFFLKKTAVPVIKDNTFLIRHKPKKTYYVTNRTPLNWNRRQQTYNRFTVKKRRKERH